MGGFLSTRGSFMLDLVFTAMMAVVPILLVSIYSVRFRRAYRWHRSLQVALATVLLVAIVAFEIEMRLYGWRHRAEPSPYWVEGSWNDWIEYSLALHLLFAIPTPFVWGIVLFRAWRGFASPPVPSAHSAAHRFWGRIAVGAMTMTAMTGWWFYWLAFMAT